MREEKFFFFEKPKTKIIKDIKVFQPEWLPPKELILFRENEIREISESIYSFVEKFQDPILIFGAKGTGKTMCTLAIVRDAVKVFDNLKVLYINCKNFSSELSFLRRLSEELDYTYRGTMTSNYYQFIKKYLEENDVKFLIIFDEIEKIYSTSGDDFIYRILEIKREIINSNPNSGISFIAITNNVRWYNELDSRIKSRMYASKKILFSQYNAEQLAEILRKRAEEGLYMENVEEGVIEKCSAIAYSEGGDARKAIDLLRVSCEIAEREGKKVSIEHVDMAEEKIERNIVINIIMSKSIHEKMVIYSTMELSKRKEVIKSKDVYDLYSCVCIKNGIKPLTTRRIRDILSTLESEGLISRKDVFTKYGRESQITLFVSPNLIKDVVVMMNEEGVVV